MKNINKTIILLFIIITCTMQSIAQQVLPKSIKLISYYDGRYYIQKNNNEQPIKAARFTIDSCIYTPQLSDSFYLSRSLFHMNRIYDLDKNHNDSTIELTKSVKQISKSLSIQFITSLIKQADTSNYDISLIDTSSNSMSIDYSERVYATIKDYSKNSFLANQKQFDRICNRKHERYSYLYNNGCSDSSITSFIKRNDDENGLFISSHNAFFIVILSFDNYIMRFTQKYPGNLNVTWMVNKDNDDVLYGLTNPSLNSLIHQIAPKNFLYSDHLLEYKKALMKLYFKKSY